MLALTFEDFAVKGSLSEQVMKKFRNLYNLMDEDLSAISLFGNDNYDSKQGLSDLLDNFTLKEIPEIFKRSLIFNLFEANGMMEWSIDGPSRCQTIDTIMPLYNSNKVLSIYLEMFSTKLEKEITRNVESVINSITEMTVHPEKIFSLKEQKYMLNNLEIVIKKFSIKLTREKIQENLDNFKNNIASNIIIQKPKPKI